MIALVIEKKEFERLKKIEQKLIKQMSKIKKRIDNRYRTNENASYLFAELEMLEGLLK